MEFRKLNYIEELFINNSSSLDGHLVHLPASGCSENYINLLKERFANYSPDFFNFLTKHNGMEIDDIRFMGDKNCVYGSIMETMKNLGVSNIMPIAKDSIGSVFFINEKHNVFLWEFKHQPVEESSFISENFNDFINSFCLGTDYSKFYGENDWYMFLQSNGWT